MQQNYDDRYAYFHYSSYDNPMIDPRELDERKRSLPDYVFRQEYLAEFIDNASGIFRNVSDCIGTGAKTSKMYAAASGGGKTGIPKSVAREYIEATPKKAYADMPERAKRKPAMKRKSK